MSENTTLGEFLADHPRLIGALTMLCLLLTQAGNVMAGNGSTIG